MLRVRMAVAVAVCTSGSAWAHDPWEFGTAGNDDNGGRNTLVHGRPQTHDLEGSGAPPDSDWYRISTRGRQSYEARIYSLNVRLALPGAGPECDAGLCATFERIDDTGLPVQAAVPVDGEYGLAVLRWTAAADHYAYLRVRGATAEAWTANDVYTVEIANTTLFAPRFNNSGTQVTVLVLQNPTRDTVTGSIDFWTGAGVLVHVHPFTIESRRTLTLNTAGLSGASGQSGSLIIAHDAGYEGLIGKAVSLEPATGFTFDTAVAPMPR
jgi:hypothetical protein